MTRLPACVLGGALMLLATGVAMFGAAPTLGATDETKSTIDPRGKPNAHKGRQTRIYIWWDAGVWHVMTRCAKGENHTFNGMVRVRGGQITESHSDDAERGKRKTDDRGRRGDSGSELAIRFHTGSQRDTLDFRVSSGSETLVFSLKVDNAQRPDLIAIGAKEVAPDSYIFTLPANPGK